MTITKDTIDRILTEQDIPAEHQADEELRAIAWSIARLDAPATPPEERALEEIYLYQFWDRKRELLYADEEDPDTDDDAA